MLSTLIEVQELIRREFLERDHPIAEEVQDRIKALVDRSFHSEEKREPYAFKKTLQVVPTESENRETGDFGSDGDSLEFTAESFGDSRSGNGGLAEAW